VEIDEQRGHVLTRRKILSLAGATGALLWARSSPARRLIEAAAPAGDAASASQAGCVVRPQQTEGPYFVDERLERADIRSDPTDGTVQPGAELRLTLHISRLAGGVCTPLAGAVFDLWHCNAAGKYSDVQDPGFDTRGQKFLRGYQVTDANGVVSFTTIYPGWYPGRTVHMHFKLRSAPTTARGFEFTSQLYFDDDFTDEVHAQQPYMAQGPRKRRNEHDRIYRRGGSELQLPVTRDQSSCSAAFDIALQLGANP
jgi:protocatechuate 3,4-dioxygenase beta subunit